MRRWVIMQNHLLTSPYHTLSSRIPQELAISFYELLLWWPWTRAHIACWVPPAASLCSVLHSYLQAPFPSVMAMIKWEGEDANFSGKTPALLWWSICTSLSFVTAVSVYTNGTVFATDTDITFVAVTKETTPLEFVWYFGEDRSPGGPLMPCSKMKSKN